MAFKGGSSIRRTSGELQKVLRITFERTKTLLKDVLEFLLYVLKMLLDVLDLSWMSWTFPGVSQTFRRHLPAMSQKIIGNSLECPRHFVEIP